MKQLNLKIDGMHCAACVRRVTAALAKLDGVRVESVEVGSAGVIYDETACSPQEIADAVNAIGFTAAVR